MADFLANLKPTNSSSGFISETLNRSSMDPIIGSPFYLSVSIASGIGNLLMVLVILCKAKFRKPVNLLVANLSFSSFLFILSTNLRVIESVFEVWDYNDRVCSVLSILHRMPIPLIALTTMTISLDRGRIARVPVLGSGGVNPIWRILAIWTFSLLILIPLGYTRAYEPNSPTLYKCKKVIMFGNPVFSVSYGIIYLLSVHVIPAVILVQESSKTINKIRFLKCSGVAQDQEGVFSTLPDHRLRLLRNSCIFCLLFLVFWLPYGVFQFPVDLPKELLPEILEAYLHVWFKFLRNTTYTLIALNPVILFVLSYDLLKNLKHITGLPCVNRCSI